MYLDKSLQTYLNDLASAQSTPGGGSTAALSGAMSAALVCMVSRLTLGKADYAAVQTEIETIIVRAEELRSRFQELLQADIDAYGRLSACFKLPRTTPAEKALRTQAIQAALVDAALVPLEMADLAVELVNYCQRVAMIGNKNVLSDIATAAMMASGAATGASWMVYANLTALKDVQRVEMLKLRLQDALDAVSVGSQRVVTMIGERV
jgi:formiminotetrahydrofolate cyclodeaminase